MKRSESISALSKAIAVSQLQVENAAKNSQNPHFKSSYADLAEILNTVRPIFSANCIAIIQLPTFESGIVSVETMLCHESGEFISNVCCSPVGKQDAQSIGSAITYLRRYSLAAMCGIAQEDDDGHGASDTQNQSASSSRTANTSRKQNPKEKKAQDDLENWKNECVNCEDANDLNELIGKIDKEHRFFTEMRQAFANAAKSLAVEFDKNTGRYVDKGANPTPAPVTDPVAEAKPEPVEQPTVEPVKVDMIALLRSITNALNIDALKDAASKVPSEGLSDKDKESIKRAYAKRKQELSPVNIDSILMLMETANTKEQLDKTWVEKVDGFNGNAGLITDAQRKTLVDAYNKCLEEIMLNQEAA